jgi:hypothetical protein
MSVRINLIQDNPELRALWFAKYSWLFRHDGPGKYLVVNDPDPTPHCWYFSDEEIDSLVESGLAHWEYDPAFNLTPAYPLYGWTEVQIEKYIQGKIAAGVGVFDINVRYAHLFR